MEKHTIETRNFDLEETLTCGQTFCWNRLEGDLYGEGSDEFYTFRDRKPVIVRQEGDTLFAETELSRDKVRSALGLDHDLEQIFASFPDDRKIQEAYTEFQGLRIVQDEFFPTLISYLLSPQMRIPRIKKLHNSIARQYGEKIEVDGNQLARFPGPSELSGVTEKDLRNLGTGYRAEYIVETVEMIGNGFKTDFEEFSAAREELKQLHGVGDKVADCVLLFSLGYHEATPLDTWARKAVKSLYPELYAESYEETSENLRQRFGDRAGYAVEYLFHAARQNLFEVET